MFDQAGYNIRCEWGEKGINVLAPISDVVVIVDVLSFSTAVEIATAQGATVYPYRWPDSSTDDSAYDFARSVGAVVANRNNESGYRLSPSSLQNLPSKIRLVIPSPNGSQLSLFTGDTPAIAGCLRNCRAVAEAALIKGKNIAVIPAGERWKDGALRPCLEDMIGAGAIIRHLGGTLSPEARAALAVFEQARGTLFEILRDCGSGREKAEKSEANDVVLASEMNISECVP